MDQFKERTKNNGLKTVEWGSDEFVNKVIKAEEEVLRDEMRRRHNNAVMEIMGM